MTDNYPVGQVLIDKWGLEWIVSYDDHYYPEVYGGKLYLLYSHANLLSIGDRKPIEAARDMQPKHS